MSLEEKKQEIFEEEMKRRFSRLVHKAFISQTDYCLYRTAPFYRIIKEKAPKNIAEQLWKSLKEAELIEI